MKIAVLDNLRSVYNVGSIFRTANAVGIEKIYLCGTTPTPVDKKGDRRKDFAKVALGAEDTVAWEYSESTYDTLQTLQNKNVFIIAIEQDKRAIDYKKIVVPQEQDVAIVMGGEVTGIQGDDLLLCDAIAEIPMLGTKESLNVTIAFGIAAYRFFDL
jgi:tRNA G18 (ribose-2'-O)-methylase SpoU